MFNSLNAHIVDRARAQLMVTPENIGDLANRVERFSRFIDREHIIENRIHDEAVFAAEEALFSDFDYDDGRSDIMSDIFDDLSGNWDEWER